MSDKNHYKELGEKLGALVDEKQEAYGDSFSKSLTILRVFLESYETTDDNGNIYYNIPESVLKHLLIQVRIIDKQFRIFTNPDGDLMGESPYVDIAGYGLLGSQMKL